MLVNLRLNLSDLIMVEIKIITSIDNLLFKKKKSTNILPYQQQKKKVEEIQIQ